MIRNITSKYAGSTLLTCVVNLLRKWEVIGECAGILVSRESLSGGGRNARVRMLRLITRLQDPRFAPVIKELPATRDTTLTAPRSLGSMIANFPRPEKLANLANTPRTIHFHKLDERKCELRQGRCNMIRCLGPMHAERKFRRRCQSL